MDKEVLGQYTMPGIGFGTLGNVGDAGAFVYTINGRSGKPLGAPGEVVSTRITLSNVQDFLTP